MTEGYLKPDKPAGTWHPITPKDLKCPKRFDPGITKRGDLESRRVVQLSKVYQSVPGVLCTKMKLITSCYVTFYFKSEITHSINPSDISEWECENSVRHGLKTESDVLDFPPESCLYLASTNTENYYIKHKRITINYDPLHNTLIHPLLEGVPLQLKSISLKTNKPQHAIYLEKKIDQCKMKFEEILIFKNNTSKELFVSSMASYNDEKVFNKVMCEHTICGRQGILTENGEWMGGIPGIHDLKLKKCSESEIMRFRYLNDNDLLTLQELNQELLMREDLCKLSLSHLKKSNLISQIDLQFFQPYSPGKHNIYYLSSNGTLYSNSAFYRKTNTTSIPDWAKRWIQDDKRSHIYNGLAVEKIKDKWVLKIDYHPSFSEVPIEWKTIHPIDETFILDDNDIPPTLVKLSSNETSHTFWSTLSDEWSLMWNNIALFFSLNIWKLISVLFIISILIWFFCCLKIVPSKPGERYQEIELK